MMPMQHKSWRENSLEAGEEGEGGLIDSLLQVGVGLINADSKLAAHGPVQVPGLSKEVSSFFSSPPILGREWPWTRPRVGTREPSIGGSCRELDSAGQIWSGHVERDAARAASAR